MSRKFFIVCAGLAIFGVLSAQAYAKQPMAISIIGNGPGGGSTAITCTNTNDPECPTFASNCWCNTATGKAKTSLAGLGGATFSADTAIITAPATGNVVGDCQAAEGKVTITSGNLHNSLVLRYTGLACFINGGFLNSQPTGITVSYTVDPSASTGKFAGATGTGTISGSEDPSGNILGNVSGNILFP